MKHYRVIVIDVPAEFGTGATIASDSIEAGPPALAREAAAARVPQPAGTVRHVILNVYRIARAPAGESAQSVYDRTGDERIRTVL